MGRGSEPIRLGSQRWNVVAWVSVALALLVVGTIGCGSGESASPTKTASGPSSTRTATPTVELVGRWERVQTCQDLVHGLDQAGLSALAPQWVSSDYFPGTRGRQLAGKTDICKGATARSHSHFFTEDGAFGSVDENGNQVDEGPYRILDSHTVRIGGTKFDYRIVHGDTLILHPVIGPAARRRALAHPFKFSPAGWQAAVSYGGLPWKRVPCEEWC